MQAHVTRASTNRDNSDTKLTVCSQRYLNHAALSPALNSLITTHSASLFSPAADFLSPLLSLSLSLSLFLSNRRATHAGYLGRASPVPFPIPHPRALTGSFTYHGFHAGSYPESGYDSVVRPASPFGLFSFFSSRSLVRTFSLSALRIPFDSPPPPARSPHPATAPSPIYREEVSHTTDSRQFSHLESQNFSPPSSPLSRFFPPFPLSTLRRPTPSPASLGVSRTPPRYIRISRAFRFHSFRQCTRISLLFFPPGRSTSRPSDPSRSTRARSRGTFSSRLPISSSQATGTRSPRSFCTVPFHHRCRAAGAFRRPPSRSLATIPVLAVALSVSPFSSPCRSFARSF